MHEHLQNLFIYFCFTLIRLFMQDSFCMTRPSHFTMCFKCEKCWWQGIDSTRKSKR